MDVHTYYSRALKISSVFLTTHFYVTAAVLAHTKVLLKKVYIASNRSRLTWTVTCLVPGGRGWSRGLKSRWAICRNLESNCWSSSYRAATWLSCLTQSTRNSSNSHSDKALATAGPAISTMSLLWHHSNAWSIELVGECLNYFNTTLHLDWKQ